MSRSLRQTAAARWPGWRGAGRFALRRTPFTTAVVSIMLVAAVATGTLWTPIGSLPIDRLVAFGLPAFDDGRWYTLAFGAFFALIPLYYVFVTGGFALLVGFAECRLGTARTAAVTVAWQLVGVVGAAGVLAFGRRTSWPWAGRIAVMTDVGFSAGMLAVTVVASLTLAAPWGLRIRLATACYAVLALLYVGLMADLEHTIAVLSVWAVGRRLAGSRAVEQGRPQPAEWRVLGAAGLVVVALLQLVVRLFPGQAPLGDAAHLAAAPLAWHALLLAVGLAAAAGWYRGRRWALPAGLAVAAADVVVAALVAVVALTSSLPAWLAADAPMAYADALTGLGLASLLIVGRSACHGRVPRDEAGSAR